MQFKTAKIERVAASLSAKELEIHAHAIVLVPATGSALDAFPFGAEIARRMRRTGYELGEAAPFVTELPNKIGTRLAIAGIDAKRSAFELLTLARKLVAAHTDRRPDRIAVAAHELDGELGARAYEAVVAAALAAGAELPSYKRVEKKKPPAPSIRVYGTGARNDFARTVAGERGNHLARYLTLLPPNELTPATYRKRVEQLARAHGWKTEFLDMKKLRALGAGAFLAVAQGSPEPDAGILRVSRAGKKSRPLLALVGKGICFDTGGVNVKPPKYMHGMHEDMEGSAVALGTLLALTELKADFPVDCWLALAQNHIGPRAYRPNEVVKAANGTSIEIMHTDAEGRMVLADTLHFASQRKPKLIIDYATLTGACVAALSTRQSGVFSNRPELIATLIKAGEASGERVWPFPLPADYVDALKSEIADTKQCTLDNDADHILAALFLKKFISHDLDWVHVDLAAGNHKGGLAHIPTDVTGFGVRFTLSLLLDQKVF